MGSGFSSLVKDESFGPGLGDLPESCVALILSYLEPSEICRLACLNRRFRQASLADTVWESKLPENHHILVKKLHISDESSEISSSKKEIFARLCRPSRFGRNTKEIWMEKRGRQICVAISWKGLKITGITDRRCWNHISTDESRFQSIAYLRQIWWVEVEGSLHFEFPAGTYSLFFRLQLGRRTSKKLYSRRFCNLEEVHGWNLKPVQFKLSSNGQQVTSEYYLNIEAAGKWTEYHVGDFVVDNADVPSNLEFSMTQIDCTHSKGGLCLDSVLIYPSNLGEKVKQLQFSNSF